MNYLLFISLFLTINITVFTQTSYPDVILETEFGNITIQLYDNTPFHCENFLKLVKEGYYNDQLFHRVIKNFMIQAGDPNSKNASAGERLGSGGPKYTIPAEFRPQYYHKKGALAAARQSDNVNPAKESSGSQFYIVQGKIHTKEELDAYVKKGIHIPFTDKQIETYTTIGGTPHLDYSYTVFGEVISGTEIIDKIASLETDKYDRPIQDIRFKIYLKK